MQCMFLRVPRSNLFTKCFITPMNSHAVYHYCKAGNEFHIRGYIWAVFWDTVRILLVLGHWWCLTACTSHCLCVRENKYFVCFQLISVLISKKGVRKNSINLYQKRNFVSLKVVNVLFGNDDWSLMIEDLGGQST